MFSRIKNQLFDHPLWRMVRWDDDHPFDLIGPVCILLLAISGVIFIHSAQAYSAGSSWKMQILWIIVGSTLYLAISLVNYKLLLEYAHHLCCYCGLPLATRVAEHCAGSTLVFSRCNRPSWPKSAP